MQPIISSVLLTPSLLHAMLKVMVCHFVSDSHEVTTALIVVLPLIVVVEISLQLHRSLSLLHAKTIPNAIDISSLVNLVRRLDNFSIQL